MRRSCDETEGQKQARLAKIEWWWTKKFSYGGGDQFIPHNSQMDHPNFFRGMRSPVKDVYLTLLFIAWKSKSWLVDATTDFLLYPLEHRGMQKAALLRHLQELERRGLSAARRGRYGKAYLLNPIGLVPKIKTKTGEIPVGEGMKFYLDARLRFAQIDPFDLSEKHPQSDLKETSQGSFRSLSESPLSLEIDRNDPQLLDLNIPYSNAAHLAPIDGPKFEKNSGAAFGRRRRSPNGQDQTAGEEGVGPSADEINRRAAERWEAIEREREAAALAESL